MDVCTFSRYLVYPHWSGLDSSDYNLLIKPELIQAHPHIVEMVNQILVQFAGANENKTFVSANVKAEF